mmetsp:Transcript_42381/g.73695  ORF Transcript_42381/g.73695 Transcript_42381/m.73695 type:complete len:306 (-) Transcript_42381:8-925(-)
MGPHLGDIERIVRQLAGLVHRHHLEIRSPRRKVRRVDRIVQIPGGIVWVRTGQLVGHRRREVLYALVSLEVPLDVVGHARGIDGLECMRAVTIHVTVAIGRAAVGEQERHLVNSLRAQGNEVPEGIGIFAVSDGVALLCVNERGKQDGIADEEDRRVVAHKIPVALLGVELHGETSRITCSIGTATLATHSGKAHSCGGLLSDSAEHLGAAIVLNLRRSDLEIAKCSSSLRMHNALWDALSVKCGQVVDESEILQCNRTLWAARQTRGKSLNRTAIGSGNCIRTLGSTSGLELVGNTISLIGHIG